MLYKNALDYINSFINFEKIPKYQYAAAFKLERMNVILEELGNPHKNLNVIHVAGSKGKGSTCAILAYILKEAGYKVGLYTSPHLVDFRERIRILNSSRLPVPQGYGAGPIPQGYGAGKAQPRTTHCVRVRGMGSRQIGQSFSLQPSAFSQFEGMIDEEDFSEIVEDIKPIVEKFREHKTLGKASFFEILTACAFLYFKKKQVDVAVLETGLGGRLDATNVATSLVSGITNISLEHTDKLGNTLSRIAYEKAGIIKKGQGTPYHKGTGQARDKGQGVVVSAKQEKEAMEAIRKVSRERNTILHEVGKDIKYTILNSNELGQVFDLKGPGYYYKNLEVNLVGAHQIENASLAIGMLKLMDPNKFNIKESNIREGLKKAVWPGRLQLIQKNPCIVLDGAHNSASALALANSIKKFFSYKRLICVFGISSDKDIKGVSSVLDAISDIIILTKARDNPRAEETSRLKQNFQNSRPGLEESCDINEAMQKALRLANKDDLILVTGSLFVVGEAMECFKTVTTLQIDNVSL